jgi:D-tyrosyl-tRNA(Tyr) deacylase
VKAVIQRVKSSEVIIDGERISQIGRGILVLIGISVDDREEDVDILTSKIPGLRIFDDLHGKMNLSLSDIEGEMMVVSQFTLIADCRKGRRPSFTKAAPPERAIQLYESFIKKCREKGIRVSTGRFGAKMDVNLINDGPVTFVIDTHDI